MPPDKRSVHMLGLFNRATLLMKQETKQTSDCFAWLHGKKAYIELKMSLNSLKDAQIHLSN